MMVALGVLLMVALTFCVGCALSWLLPSQISKIILPAKTSYGTIDHRKEKEREPITYIFFILSLFGWILIYYNAFYQLLFFLPDDWGRQNEYSDWASYRSGISGTASFWLSIFTLVQLEKLNKAYIAYNTRPKDKGDLNP